MHEFDDPGRLPLAFCWTRFGTEAGESIQSILARKEVERCANDGLFYWGIGNSVAPGMVDLTAADQTPEVLFSPMRSRPRAVDVAPAAVVRWQMAIADGAPCRLPNSVRVTSRLGRPLAKASHYALVCWSPEPLVLADLGWLRFAALRNLRSGNAVGASQVTAIVSRETAVDGDGSDYRVALRARLVEPYFVRLAEPVIVDGGETALGMAA